MPVARDAGAAFGKEPIMKAIAHDVYGPPGVLELREVGPPLLRDDDVLVRVHAAGVDPGVWHLTAGMPYLVRLMGLGFSAPRTHVRGVDFAGRVAEVGRNVREFRPGDEVYGSCDPVGGGSFAEYTVASLDRLAAMPAGLTFVQAAAVPVSACTALQALRDRGGIERGQRVLIIGAGGVGTFAVQLAKAFGAGVTCVCSTGKVDLARSIGADDVIDYTREDFPDGTRRYDLIVDTGGRRGLNVLRRALAPGGTLVIVGGEGGNRWTGGFDRQMLRAPLLSRFVGQDLKSLVAEVCAEDLETLRELIETGKVAPVIDRTYPLAEAPEALRYLHEEHPGGKVVVTIETD
jgi:2-desacetyl-2-hydroxyethyl bacteriochlorophyllide A dehydrogenase